MFWLPKECVIFKEKSYKRKEYVAMEDRDEKHPPEAIDIDSV